MQVGCYDGRTGTRVGSSRPESRGGLSLAVISRGPSSPSDEVEAEPGVEWKAWGMMMVCLMKERVKEMAPGCLKFLSVSKRTCVFAKSSQDKDEFVQVSSKRPKTRVRKKGLPRWFEDDDWE